MIQQNVRLPHFVSDSPDYEQDKINGLQAGGDDYNN